jgi:hypothetical protein
VLRMLVAVLCFYDVSAPGSILRHGGVPLIVIAGVADRAAPITGRSDARWPLVGRAGALWLRSVMAASIGVEWLSAWTLVQRWSPMSMAQVTRRRIPTDRARGQAVTRH